MLYHSDRVEVRPQKIISSRVAPEPTTSEKVKQHKKDELEQDLHLHRQFLECSKIGLIVLSIVSAIGLFLIIYSVCYFKYRNDLSNQMREQYQCQLTGQFTTPRCGLFPPPGELSNRSGWVESKPALTVYTILANCTNSQKSVGEAVYLVNYEEYEYMYNNDVKGIVRDYYYSPTYDGGEITCDGKKVPIFYKDQNNFNFETTNWIIFLVLVVIGSVLSSTVFCLFALVETFFSSRSSIVETEQELRLFGNV